MKKTTPSISTKFADKYMIKTLQIHLGSIQNTMVKTVSEAADRAT